MPYESMKKCVFVSNGSLNAPSPFNAQNKGTFLKTLSSSLVNILKHSIGGNHDDEKACYPRIRACTLCTTISICLRLWRADRAKWGHSPLASRYARRLARWHRALYDQLHLPGRRLQTRLDRASPCRSFEDRGGWWMDPATSRT